MAKKAKFIAKYYGRGYEKDYVFLEYEYRGHTYTVYENRAQGNEPLSWQHKNEQERIIKFFQYMQRRNNMKEGKRTGLKADSKGTEIILDYLEENTSDVLAEKIKTGNKTLGQCWTYIVKQAEKQKEGKCACIPDIEVFGWAIHFFEEDSITENEISKPVARVEVKEVKKSEPKAEKPKKEKSPREEMLPGQMTIFDLMGGGMNES